MRFNSARRSSSWFIRAPPLVRAAQASVVAAAKSRQPCRASAYVAAIGHGIREFGPHPRLALCVPRTAEARTYRPLATALQFTSLPTYYFWVEVHHF